jgi:hypothetical protein
MAPKKIKKRKLSSEQIAAANQVWDKLEADLDQEMLILDPSRLRAGRILYYMKRWLKQWNLLKGRHGRWDATCTKHRINRKTAENWIVRYQERARIPAHEWVVQPPAQPKGKKSQLDWKKNTVKATGLVEPSITPADDEDHDSSRERRLAIECIFVLTMAEKHTFMDAVKALGELRATQEMYKAVIAAAPKVSGVGA